MKTESIQEFLARGGKITFGPAKEAKGSIKKTSSKPIKEAKPAEEASEKINYSSIPLGLRMALGIKE